MNRDDILFRRACQQWYDRYGRCVKEASATDARTLLDYVEQQLNAWKRHHINMRASLQRAERTLIEARQNETVARDRLKILSHLHASMKRGEQKLHEMVRVAAEKRQKHEIKVVAEESKQTGGDDGNQEK